ncbi:Asp-tRNA(Asn)/Glu-tRNA(Gln) amidotransferase subunit GatB [Hydrogenimonas thermophila]|uniref:Aspartyl/glutamyl-tRNA(Asn/Gln) amidotransferase subunit B n=1 Tax=Hydrogenimonas thermophila TaxID=223786 RepID=A0A1I5NW88_9BACT|nr:Asp-tRNA(Asn)/Glu-tRNA(Gln) amidotransferase subunit GatB [Hydrogenimonas thermophila]SFP26055.1 aspartyl/glutamyl-tRNA(Asn/Gln) amidotransferase subunit B [Hydrogenimonas thermophila]
MFEVIIGLEVHVQLNTKTKIFCNCATSFADHQNSHTCPVCLGLPGALPVLNKEAVKKAMMFGNAIEATVHKKSVFNRKNYFYPDLPKGYQISQFEIPIVENGHLMIDFDDGSQKRIGITRAHLEEDAGKNSHEGDHSLVDLNRAGTPLLEIVSEPDMRSADEAVRYLKKLHSIVRYLGISDANMQEGSFRCDVNVSIRPKGDDKLYTRVEIKNMNSFRFIHQAIDYEVQRQIEAWEDGVYNEEVWQETRLFDTVKGETRSMRGKEDSADYRYFPEPDLLPVILDDEMIEEAKNIPEMPDAKRARYVKDFGIREYDAVVITSEVEMARFYEEMIEEGANPKEAAKWLTIELQGRLKGGMTVETSPVSAKQLALIVKRIEESTISGKAGKDVLDYLFENQGADVDEVIEKLGLKQVSDDGAILALIDEVLANNQDKVEEYKGGKEKLFGFFVGQVMKASKGSANPGKVNQLLKERLNS